MRSNKKFSNGARIAAVAAGILLLAGCGKQAANNNQSAGNGQNQSGAISSIEEAMGLGKTMRCTYRVKTGSDNMEMTTYVKGEKYSTETSVGGATQKVVFDGNTMYSWSEGKKQGIKMTKSCMEELGQSASQNENGEEATAPSAEENNFANAVGVKCEAASADFSVPSDVSFTDQCDQMKKAMENIKNMNQNQNGTSQGMPDIPENMPGAPQMVQ